MGLPHEPTLQHRVAPHRYHVVVARTVIFEVSERHGDVTVTIVAAKVVTSLLVAAVGRSESFIPLQSLFWVDFEFDGPN